VVRFTLLMLYPWGKSPRNLQDRRLGGPQSRSERLGEEKFFTLPGLELQPVASRYTDYAILGNRDSSVDKLLAWKDRAGRNFYLLQSVQAGSSRIYPVQRV
jgi:hypothetical protein